MKIYIPTAAREKQLTASTLLVAGIDFTLVVPRGKKSDYDTKKYHVIESETSEYIAPKRQWILDRPTKDGKVVMLDDDLTFYARTTDNKWPRADISDIRRMFKTIEATLDDFAHGGLVEKFMSQARPWKTQYNKRYFHILCYNKKLFPDPPPRFQVATAEDIQMALSLMLGGRAGFMLTCWAHADKAHAPGGCDLWRTDKIMRESYVKLVKKFPEVVSINPKNPMHMKVAWRKAAQLGGCYMENPKKDDRA